MDFQLSPDLIEMKKSIRDFIDYMVDPLADQIDREDHIPEHIMKMTKDIGLFGLSIPVFYGKDCSQVSVTNGSITRLKKSTIPPATPNGIFIMLLQAISDWDGYLILPNTFRFRQALLGEEVF